MASRADRTQTSIRRALPKLLAAQGLSQREFAARIGFPQSYLSRTLSAERSPSKRFLEAAARGLGLPKDYFPEYRQHVVIDALKRRPALRDKIYDSLR